MQACLDVDTIRELGRQHGLTLVVLFGSQGRRPDSDWDLALQAGSAVDQDQVEESFVRSLQRADLDFLWLSQASPLAAAQVANQGQALYQDRPERFGDFQIAAQLRRSDHRLWQEGDRQFVKRTLEENWSLNTPLVTRKLAQLARYFNELSQIMQSSQADFEADFRIHRVCERLIELLVECAASINSEVAQSVARIPPSDYYSSFYSMAATGWIDREVAGRLATLAGLRNRLVHQYEEIRLGQLYKAAQKSLPDWKLYLQGVSEHLA
ncbi:DUF86 domain-containing protein [bacterium]|nr:DUF86 domain-containing protein [bacterium]